MWLKTTEIYSFTVLVARGPNPGVIRVVLPPEAIEELLFLSLPVSDSARLVITSFQYLSP